MISKIAALIQNFSNLSTTKEFNNALPVLLHILKKEGKELYTIKMGNIVTKTKSQKELIIGAKYFANVTKSSVDSILLRNLVLYPKTLENLKEAPLKLQYQELQTFLSKDAKNFFEEYKNLMLDYFANSHTKNEFLFFGNMLLSLQKEILSLVVNQNNKESFLQIKKNKQNNILEFYALYPNLGNLNGMVYKLEDSGIGLKIQTEFESVKELLEYHCKELESFSQILITKTTNIEPLYLFEDHLLNLRA